MKSSFKFVFAIIVILMLFGTASAECFFLDPFCISDKISERISDSHYAAVEELKSDPTLVAACHMEFWRNQSNVTWYDGSGIHYGVKEGAGMLNYVCYYRDNATQVGPIGVYDSYSDALSTVLIYYRGYVNGNNGWVYPVPNRV